MSVYQEPMPEPLEGSEGPSADPGDARAALEGGARRVAAWTEVDPGRFMPRRVRGSCVGRALG